MQRLEVRWGYSGLRTLAPGFTLRVLPEGRGGGPKAPYDRPKSNQMGWGAPWGRRAIRHRYLPRRRNHKHIFK